MSLFDISKLEKELKILEEKTSDPNFWSDNNNSSIVLKKINELKLKTEEYKNTNNTLINIIEIQELLKIDSDENLEQDFIKSIKKLEKDIDKLEINTLLSGKYDSNNAIITLHPGAGGTESCDWTQMLYRMYTRWANANGYEVKELDYLDGDEAGIKSVTALILGPYAYGKLKAEMGVHRLVRISPFDSGARRHTSFASLEVLPEITEDIQIDINPDDLRIDTYRASGAGGQHINKTDSAVRFTHIPTGIVVACQSERSQIMNRQSCMNMLKARLYEYYREQKEKENSKFASEKKDIYFGSQIRSYVFCPYTMVKDHRTKFSVGNIQGVMDGDLDEFMNAYLVAKWKGLPMDGTGDDDEEV